MNAAELRANFLSYFEKLTHRVVPSSPVIPHGDPTLLFTNAGMNQFKDVLLGQEIRDYKRATSVQKCIRAGGKHNDLDEVGRDGRHLTCFEMLGNWSFGDYYKKEAIAWAWAYVTKELGLDQDRLYVAVYKDDDASARIWKDEVGVPADRIARYGNIEEGDEENFWSMGATGPCGPCTEIFYDIQPELDAPHWGPGFDEERLVEIWNLVFMEFNRDAEGVLSSLPIRSVDTGMGLERVLMILEGKRNVFHTDAFASILVRTAELLGTPFSKVSDLHEREDFQGFAVIADHLRAVCFSLADGGMFSNEGRGYVLRRVLRRAVRFGRMLGFEKPFLHELAPTFIEHMGNDYPELRATQNEIGDMIRLEEERFFRTLDRGIARFEQVAGAVKAAGKDVIAGDEAFKLYDTYGFPVDLTEIMAEEQDLQVDRAGFNTALKAQQDRARKSDTHTYDDVDWLQVRDGVADQSVAWDKTVSVTKILRLREHSETGDWEILLRETPFYAESGGQVGDTGVIQHVEGAFTFEVTDTRRTPSGMTHICRLVEGTPTRDALGGDVRATVDASRRFLITCNHTATHLLHAALHEVVSEKAYQAGSLVTPDRLRFDYSFHRPLTEDEVRAVEDYVNIRVGRSIDLAIHVNVPREEAERMGAMAIFGEKYGESVRVVEVPGESVELCGGCHVSNTRDIAFFRITAETGVAAGVRRIEAVANHGAFELARSDRDLLNRITTTLKTEPGVLDTKVRKLVEEQQALYQRTEALARRLAEVEARQITSESQSVGDVHIAAAKVDASTRQELLYYIDAVRPKLPAEAVVLLGATIDGKPALACLVSDGLFKNKKIKAGDLINEVAPIVGGRGGGRPTLAQAGGRDASKLDAALDAFFGRVQARLQSA